MSLRASDWQSESMICYSVKTITYKSEDVKTRPHSATYMQSFTGCATLSGLVLKQQLFKKHIITDSIVKEFMKKQINS